MAAGSGQLRLTARFGLRSLAAFEVLRGAAMKLRGNKVNALAAPATVNGRKPFDTPLPQAGR